ncbi:DUF1961 family protein [Paenibacillus koleovorans]|uniref:DUF1961 family protein n=1 Tax=Paenibacillus koleovorans TaxID=121608 RepID=UPI000FDB1FB1|nr:DUF1961 family protein [Paenibacillus koleovorans]
MRSFNKKELLYHNPLASATDIRHFRMEGPGKAEIREGRLQLEELTSYEGDNDAEQQATNIVYWCDVNFPSDILVEWEFWPVQEPGLCILFFSAQGRNGEDLFDPKLKRRDGSYEHYNHGDINAFHLSYYRRKYEKERSFHLCILRKSYGHHLVGQAANPLPDVSSAIGPYRMTLVKCEADIAFYINDLPILNWRDDGNTYGPLLAGGKIGFRQMSPGIFQYSHLRVFAVEGE